MKNFLRFAILSLLVIMFSHSIAFSASFYYVDNSVVSSGNGSQTSPWKNWSNVNWTAISSASKPCTIYISGGATSQTYNEMLSVGASGSGEGSEIIIKCPTSAEWPGHSGIVYFRSSTSDICETGRSWIIIDGLDMSSTASGGRGVFFNGATNCVLRNSTIRNTHGLSVAGYNATHITLHRNILGPNPNGDDPLQFNGDNWTIEYNIFQGGWSEGPHWDDIQIGNGSSSLNLIIRYNIFREANSAVIALYDADMGAGENVSMYVFGNIFEFTSNGGSNGNWTPCIEISGSTAWVKAYIYNNIFVNFTYQGGLGGHAIGTSGSNSSNVYDIRNNIFYNSQMRLQGSGTKTSDYNIFYMTYNGTMTNWNGTDYLQSQFAAYKTASGQDSHSLNTNPLLASVSATFNPNHDLRPTASSPGINAGANIGSSYDLGLSVDNTKSSWPLWVTTISRPAGSGWDIGPYEYGDNNPPQVPRNLRIVP